MSFCFLLSFLFFFPFCAFSSLFGKLSEWQEKYQKREEMICYRNGAYLLCLNIFVFLRFGFVFCFVFEIAVRDFFLAFIFASKSSKSKTIIALMSFI